NRQQRRDRYGVAERFELAAQRSGITLGTGDQHMHQAVAKKSGPARSRISAAILSPSCTASAALAVPASAWTCVPLVERISARKYTLPSRNSASPAMGVRHEPSSCAR